MRRVARRRARRAVRRHLEADVLALAVAVEPEHEVVRTLGLVLEVRAHRAARGHLGRLRAEEELRVDVPRLPAHAKRAARSRSRAHVCVSGEAQERAKGCAHHSGVKTRL